MLRGISIGFVAVMLVSLFPGVAAADAADPALCWRKNIIRGAGMIPNECGAGQERDAGLCYPACKAGYNGNGPFCWTICPAGFKDDGAFCRKPEGQKKDSVCPPGAKDMGVTCEKDSYSRGLGDVPACKAGLEANAGLCYEQSCPSGYKAVAATCFSVCPAEFPINCGAACAKTKGDCGAAIADMSLNTTMVAVNVLLMIVGAPGVGTAAKSAATAGLTAVKTATTRYGVAEISKVALKAGAKKFAKKFIIELYEGQIRDPRNAIARLYSLGKSLYQNGRSLSADNELAEEAAGMKVESGFDWESIMVADITGVSAAIYSFSKHPSCQAEDLSVNVDRIDFGKGPVSPSEEKQVEITFGNNTTVTEITTTPLVGASIDAQADCVGKEFRPGQKCTLRVKVTGKDKIIGEVRIFTTAYHTIPFAIEVNANTAATAEHAYFKGAEEAVNVSSIAGAWAFDGDQARKIVISPDGAVSSFRGPGTVQVVDAIQRQYSLKLGSDGPFTVTLAPEHETFEFAPSAPAPYGKVTALRRPWFSRCKPGEQRFGGLCYDIPFGYAPTSPGLMGKVCEPGFRDDGTSCWPRWEGKVVAGQANPEGGYLQRYPIVVTDCHYAKASGNECPKNYRRTAACTCQAEPRSKGVKPIAGTPMN